ncbi:MAG: DUF4097 family beta strand repeat-containing protein [Bdellovibrionales bacterium]
MERRSTIEFATGELRLNDHEGSVDVNNYKTKITVNQLKGPLKLSNFDGTVSLQNIEGGLQLSSHKGQMSVSRSKGRLQFESGDNNTVIEDFDGSIKGKSGQGAIVVRSEGKINVNLRSNQGRIDIQAKGSGATVNVGSKDGPLYLPNYFKLTRYANMKVMSGRLRGGSGGQIYVRTESGSVKLR